MRRIRPFIHTTVSYSHLPSWTSSLPFPSHAKYLSTFLKRSNSVRSTSSSSFSRMRIHSPLNSQSFHSRYSSLSLSSFPRDNFERVNRIRNKFRQYGLFLTAIGIGGPLVLTLHQYIQDEEEAINWGWNHTSSSSSSSNSDNESNDDYATAVTLDDNKPSGRTSNNNERSRLFSSSSSSSSSSSFIFLSRNIDDEIQKMINDAFGTSSSSSSPGSSSSSPRSSSGGSNYPPPLPPPSPILPSLSSSESIPAGKLTVASIIGINTLVWGLWQIPHTNVANILQRWFLTSPVYMGSGLRGYTSMFLSTYSHKSFFHLLANMVGLWSFGPLLMMGRHTVQRPRLSVGEFLSLYTVGGVLASLGSNLFMASLRLPRPGLGASGSIFAILTYFTLGFPESRMLLFFFINTSAYTALGAATGLNLYLVYAEIRAARTGRPGPTFDGMAHLVGTIVGAAWFYAARARARRKGVTEGGNRYGGGGSITARSSLYGSNGQHHRPGSGSDIDV